MSLSHRLLASVLAAGVARKTIAIGAEWSEQSFDQWCLPAWC